MKALFSCLFLMFAASAFAADEPDFSVVSHDYASGTRSLIEKYCVGCHSTEDKEGELDLEQFVTLDDVRKSPRAWQKVAEMLDNGEMPPQDADQPTVDERRELRSWVQKYLDAEARASAGDPGPVVLRRLSNAEYTYTVRDLTGAPLNPAREFPGDNAAGEGFTNAGNALVMSPALLSKYFDAGKGIAAHAVLLPDGFRFSPGATRRDWTNETLDRIRSLYARYCDSEGGSQVNLQGIVFETNGGGRLPLEAYLAATLMERDALRSGAKSLVDVAHERNLSPKYLTLLWNLLAMPNAGEPSLLMDGLRSEWNQAAPEDVPALAAGIVRWQQTLWKFSSVGHIGKVGGPKAWMEPVSPLVARQELRLKLPEAEGDEVVFYLSASDAGDGNDHDFVVWERPRFVAPGRPDLLLRDVRATTRELNAHRERLFASASRALGAAAEAGAAKGEIDVQELAQRHDVEPESLAAWLEYLGIGAGGSAPIESLLTRKQESAEGHDFIKGWVGDDALSVVANSSDEHVRIPGNMAPHGVAMHPSPTLQVAAGWRSPIAGKLTISGVVQHAHPECGNGVAWTIELRRGTTKQRLIAGFAQGGAPVTVGPVDNVAVHAGDVIAVLIGPRDGNHSCDLTAVNLTIRDGEREWDLAKDVSSNILAGNPHADSLGNAEVWHFFSEPVTGGTGLVIPTGSLLARWQSASGAEEQSRLADEVQSLLQGGIASLPPDSPDVALYRQLASLDGPLFSAALRSLASESTTSEADADELGAGLDPRQFGKHPDGSAIEPASLCVQAPALIEVRLPADLAHGAEFVTGGSLHAPTGAEGSVQLHLLTTKPDSLDGLEPSVRSETVTGSWTSGKHAVSHSTPILVNEGSATRRRLEAAFHDFRQMFPAALCYSKIVPVDEVITLILFHREDEPLCRLMLDDSETAELDRLWTELRFVSQDALTMVDAFSQLLEYASQDADPTVFEPLRQPILDRAAALRAALVAAEPPQIDALVRFASDAYRRPLTDDEDRELRDLYHTLRSEELSHDEAFRFLMARLFVSPKFLYRLEEAPPGTEAAPVDDWELASRLSYFLWSSAPDQQLRAAAAAGTLHEPEILTSQMGRMLKDARVRRLATEFACQWLHIYEFDTLDEKSERHFPEFNDLKDDMYEESIRFFTNLFQSDGSVLGIFDADHLYVNGRMATFYGIPGVTGDDWVRVDHARDFGRGGILGMATTLAKQSGASRTSPILRGNWVSEVLLGERLPRPPPNIPILPEDEGAVELTIRELVEKHSSDPSCVRCHERIDPFGFSLEAFDAIGARREKDLGGRPIDVRTKVMDGTEIEGLDGLRDYLLTTRRDAILRQFCKKLLGYSLGRGVQLSDEPLLEEIRTQLKENDYRFSVAVETIVKSRQFREILCSNLPNDSL